LHVAVRVQYEAAIASYTHTAISTTETLVQIHTTKQNSYIQDNSIQFNYIKCQQQY
jgi:hypothetical protein